MKRAYNSLGEKGENMSQTVETVEPFKHYFSRQLPREKYGENKWDRYKGLPTLESIIDECVESVSSRQEFQALPERNQKLLQDMSSYIINTANSTVGTWDAQWAENYWGLYIVGSRARGNAQPDSDLDLLSVGTFYRSQGFRNYHDGDDNPIFDGFDLELPSELPSEYNVGVIDRKYLCRAVPTEEGVLPVDLNVVDLTFINANLGYFKAEMDTDENSSPLPRLPLVEVVLAQR